MKSQNTLESTESYQHTPLYVVRSNYPLRYFKNEEIKGLRSRYYDRYNNPLSANILITALKAIPWAVLLCVLILA